jgi:hypothetical protein
MRIQLSVVAVLALVVSQFTSISFARADSTGSPAAEKEWTLLVYLNGNNSLDSFGTSNLLQMEKVGSTSKINVVVQWASLAAAKTTRLLIKKSTDSTKVTSPVVQDLGAADMGDYRTLVDFIKWGAANYPAKHYFVDVWDHGNGWHGRLMNAHAGSIRPMDVSWDDNTGHYFTTNQLGEALAEGAAAIGHKIDVYSSDACLMAMAEIADQVSDSVEIYAGSEEVEPGPGWPYDTILEKWNKLNSPTAAQVGKLLATEYTNSYKGGENGTSDVTFSAYDMSKMPAFKLSMAALAKQVATFDTDTRKKALTAASSTQTFTNPDYADLIDFLDNMQASKVGGVDAATVNAVRASVKDLVIANEVTTLYAKGHGIAFWLPQDMGVYNQYSDYYKTLSFDEATDWGGSLKYLLQDTQSSGSSSTR